MVLNDKLNQARIRARQNAGLTTTVDEAPAQGGGGFDLLDVGQGVVAGAEEAVHDAYGLIDILSFDLLPDWDEQRFFEKADTTAGKVVQGISQFATGFLATGFGFGAAAKVASLANFAKASQALSQALSQVARAETLTGNLVLGATTDFAFFDGQEGRLADAVVGTDYEPLLGWLASDEDDTEFEARIKNSIEGLGLGAATDVIMASFRGMKGAAFRKQADEAAKVSVEDIARAARTEVTTRAKALREKNVETLAAKANDVDPVKVDAEALRVSGIEDLEAARDYADSVMLPTLDPASKEPGRRLSKEQLEKLDMTKQSVNLLSVEGDDSVFAALRTYEYVGREYVNSASVSHAQTEAAAIKSLSDIMVLDDAGLQGMALRGTRAANIDAESLSQIRGRMVGYNMALNLAADDWWKRVDAVDDLTKLSDLELSEIMDATNTASAFMEAIRGVKSEFGRGLNAMKIKTRVDTNLLKGSAKKDALQRAEEKILKEGGKFSLGASREVVINQIGRLKNAMDSSQGDRSAFLNAFYKGVTPLGKGKRWSMAAEYWYGSVLSGPKTWAVNFIGNTAALIHRPVELAAGGAVQFAFGGGSRGLAHAWDSVVGLVHAGLDMSRLRSSGIIENVYRSAKNNESVLIRDAGHEASKILQGNAITKGTVAESLKKWQARGALAEWERQALASAGDAVGKAARVPGSILQATDELFKNLNFRSDAFAHLRALGRERGLGGSDLNNFVAERMDRIITDGQAMSQSQLYSRAYDAAKDELGERALNVQLLSETTAQKMAQLEKENADLLRISELAGANTKERTFTESLQDNNVIHRAGRLVEGITRAFPAMRVFVPFIRTPTNLLKFADERLPREPIAGFVDYASRRLRGSEMESLKDAGNRTARTLAFGTELEKAEMYGRFAQASVGVGTLFYFAMNGVMEEESNGIAIYGRGPEDPKEREAWEAAGRLPYSIRIGDKYFSYERLDPFSTMIGTVADAVQYSHFAKDDAEVEDVIYALTTATANNFTRKSYLTGLDNFMSLLRAGDATTVERVFQQIAGSVVPAFSAQVTQGFTDDEMKETRSMVDAMMARVPLWSGHVEPRRDVLGREMARVGFESEWGFTAKWMGIPITDAERADPVYQELARLEHPWRPIGRTMRTGGVSLDLLDYRSESGQTALDRYRELSGSVTIGGRTVYDALKDTFERSGYKAIPPITGQDVENPRVAIARRIISAYRTKAKQQLFKEYEELGEQVKTVREQNPFFK